VDLRHLARSVIDERNFRVVVEPRVQPGDDEQLATGLYCPLSVDTEYQALIGNVDWYHSALWTMDQPELEHAEVGTDAPVQLKKGGIAGDGDVEGGTDDFGG
jgi:hypothetical protein